MRHGVVVVARQSATKARWASTGAARPAFGKDVIGVASFDNTRREPRRIHDLVLMTSKIGYIAAAGAPPPPETGIVPHGANRHRRPRPTTAARALPAGSLTGKVALDPPRDVLLLSRRRSTRRPPAPLGVVLLQQRPGIHHRRRLAGVPPITIPVGHHHAPRRRVIDGCARRAETSTMTWTSLVVERAAADRRPHLQLFVLRPAADLSFKPDIGAPGGSDPIDAAARTGRILET